MSSNQQKANDSGAYVQGGGADGSDSAYPTSNFNDRATVTVLLSAPPSANTIEFTANSVRDAIEAQHGVYAGNFTNIAILPLKMEAYSVPPGSAQPPNLFSISYIETGNPAYSGNLTDGTNPMVRQLYTVGQGGGATQASTISVRWNTEMPFTTPRVIFGGYSVTPQGAAGNGWYAIFTCKYWITTEVRPTITTSLFYKQEDLKNTDHEHQHHTATKKRKIANLKDLTPPMNTG